MTRVALFLGVTVLGDAENKEATPDPVLVEMEATPAPPPQQGTSICCCYPDYTT